MVNQLLLARFLQVYTFQPATAFWRAVEIDIFQKYLPTSGVVLDLGCGDGNLTAILYGRNLLTNLTLVGIDADEEETCYASKQSIYKRVHTCWASNIPEPDNSFDHVISNSVLEHIEDIEATIAEVSRLLKPGGTFTFSVPSTGFYDCLKGPLFPGVSRDKYVHELDKRLAHYRYWSTDEWWMPLEKFGLIIEQHEKYLSREEVRRWEIIHRFTAGLFYIINRNKNKPIEIQRKLGMRRAQNFINLPNWLADIFARFLLYGVRYNYNEDKKACLLILARKIM